MHRLVAFMIVATVLVGGNSCTDSTAPDTTPAVIAVSPASQTLMSGMTLTLAARVSTRGNTVLTSAVLTWKSSDEAVVTVSANGLVTAVKAGVATITASVGGLAADPVTITVVPGAPALLAIVTQPSGAASGAPLSSQPVIEVRDAAGNLATSARGAVVASIASGGGTLSGDTATVTDGIARFKALSVSGKVGDRTLAFSLSGVPSVMSAPLLLNGGAAAALVIATQPAGAMSGAPVLAQPVIEVRDAAGNLATNAGGTVVASIASGGGTITGDTAFVTMGVARFTNLTLSGTTGDRTLAFTLPSVAAVPSVTSAPLALGSGAPRQLIVTFQPTTVAVGANFGLRVELRDAAGNLTVSGYTVNVAIASGGGTLGGRSTAGASTVDGVATWQELAFTGRSGVRTLVISGPGADPILSAPITVTPGPPQRVVKLSGDDQTAEGGTVLALQPTVQVLDAFNNPVPGAAVSTRADSGGVSTSPRFTDSTGTVAITWTLGFPAGLQTLTTTVGGVTTQFHATATKPPIVLFVNQSKLFLPAPLGLPVVYNDSLLLDVGVTSTFQLASVRATLGSNATSLTYGQSGSWKGVLSTVGEPSGLRSAVITATDVFGTSRTLLFSFIVNRLPKVQATLPLNYTVGRPDISISATCTDDAPLGCTLTIAGSIPNVSGSAVFGRSTGAPTARLSATVSPGAFASVSPSFATYGGPVDVSVVGEDQYRLSDGVRRRFYLEPSTHLAEVASVDGVVFDKSGSRVLSADVMSTLPFVVRLTDTGLGRVDTIQTGRQLTSGYVTPTGVLFTSRGVSGADSLYEWRNGTISNLGVLYTTLRVSGNYASYVNSGSALLRRDLNAGTNTQIATNNPPGSPDVAANGDVVYLANLSGNQRVFRYRNGVVTAISTTTASPPVTDGTSVIYSRVAGTGSELVLNVDGAEQVIASSTAAFGFTYFINSGWIAYSYYINDASQAFVRSPTGATRQLTFLGTSSVVQGVGADGSVVYELSGARYYVAPGGTGVAATNVFTSVVWRDSEFLFLEGRTVFRFR